MIKIFIKKPVYVFIDAENLFYSQRTLGWLISYEKLMTYFKKECGSKTKVFVYTGIDENSLSQRKFLDMLSSKGFIVRTREVKKYLKSDGMYKWKNNLDMELAFEMVETKDKYNTAILISGDGDFSVPIIRIKKSGKRILVMSTRGHVSKELLELSKYIDLRKLKNEFMR